MEKRDLDVLDVGAVKLPVAACYRPNGEPSNRYPGSKETAAPAVVHFGDCKLDLRAHKLFKHGREVPLTTNEFRLLELFTKRPGRALTRDQIPDAVWGNDIIVNDRSVDRCVTTLRAKVEADPRHRGYIRTIRDIGCRFEYV
jgi:DNA-binding response OmpR family regulator